MTDNPDTGPGSKTASEAVAEPIAAVAPVIEGVVEEKVIRPFKDGINPVQAMQLRQQALAFAFNRLSLTPVEKRDAEPVALAALLADAETIYSYMATGK